MGPSRHTRTAAAAAAAGASSSRSDGPASSSSFALTSTEPAPKTPTRPSPYARTPTKAPTSSALTLGPRTPTSRTSSPMMLREIFSMISPFRGFSRARRSAAFGGGDEVDMDQEPRAGTPLRQESKLDQVEEDDDTVDRMIEDAEEGFSASAVPPASSDSQSSQLSALREVPSSPSRTSRSSLAAPPKTLPLANDALVTPGLRRQFNNAQPEVMSSTPLPSTSYAPPTQTSPVSRNYDLLARFFAEKQRGGQGGLTEVEVEGCIRLIEESMADGRNLESEFASASTQGRGYPHVQRTGFAPSSRASSIAPPAFPSSQSTNALFHPGTSKMNASSSAYSFLAPRAPASQSGFGGASTSTRSRRPIYVGPGMSSLSLRSRRPVVASASRAAEMAKSQAAGGMPRSSTDPNLAGLARRVDDTPDASARNEEAKRRRTAVDVEKSFSSSRGLSSSQTVQFEPAYEKEARQSSLLARDIAASSSANSASASPLKRAAPSVDATATSSTKTSPPKAPTRTASAIQDILKTTPPVRAPTKPELVNPYQSTAPLAAKSKPSAEAGAATAAPVRRSARTTMLTRAKARETAKASEKHSPPKESVLDLIERTAPKTISKRKAPTEAPQPEPQRNGKSSAPEPVAAPAAEQPSEQERKLQKTEEVQRRLEALTKAKNQPQDKQEPQSSAPKPAAVENKAAKVSANLLPPQYTATKPKKPSPLSAAFQAPDSPSSDSETAAPAQSRGPAVAQPNFSFGASAAKTSAPSSGFSFSASKSATSSAPSTAAAPSGGFSFSKPITPATTSAPASSAAPAPSTSFSFSPVSAAPTPQQKPAATNAPATSGFSFTVPSSTTSTPPTVSKSNEASSVRKQVLAEDVSKLPSFDWQVPAVTTSSSESASQALRDEIRSAAEAALPKFDFIYEVETSAPAEKKDGGASAKAAAPISGGFSFSPAAAPAPSTPEVTTTTAIDGDTAESTDDTSTPQPSGLLGEGEGEQTESTLLEVRAKIWRLDLATKSWKDLGICVAKIKHDASTDKHRLLARNEANGKVAVNFRTYKGLKCTTDKTVNSFLGFDGQEPMQLRLKVKTEDMATEFKDKLEATAAKS